MKNFLKIKTMLSIAGIIAIAALIGFSVIACDEEGSTIINVSKVTGVTLNKDKLPLDSGDTDTLTATIKPETALFTGVTWSSDDPLIATVIPSELGGKTAEVTGVSEGTTKIIVTAMDGSGEKAECEVTVTETTVKVQSVEISDTAASIEKGKTKTLTATITPTNPTNSKVRWSSSNTLVATVDISTGVVTGVNTGKAAITVTTLDGGFQDICVVTVTAP